jgi:hypothetical protein
MHSSYSIVAALSTTAILAGACASNTGSGGPGVAGFDDAGGSDAASSAKDGAGTTLDGGDSAAADDDAAPPADHCTAVVGGPPAPVPCYGHVGIAEPIGHSVKIYFGKWELVMAVLAPGTGTFQVPTSETYPLVARHQLSFSSEAGEGTLVFKHAGEGDLYEGSFVGTFGPNKEAINARWRFHEKWLGSP